MQLAHITGATRARYLYVKAYIKVNLFMVIPAGCQVNGDITNE
jgi:hypothetical protein